jgi:hypothetical protein
MELLLDIEALLEIESPGPCEDLLAIGQKFKKYRRRLDQFRPPKILSIECNSDVNIPNLLNNDCFKKYVHPQKISQHQAHSEGTDCMH